MNVKYKNPAKMVENAQTTKAHMNAVVRKVGKEKIVIKVCFLA